MSADLYIGTPLAAILFWSNNFSHQQKGGDYVNDPKK
jgi:hypothetical protein